MSVPTTINPAPGIPATPPSDPGKFELFLLVGQSNIAGRAPVLPEDQVADPRVLVLDRTNQWVTQAEPFHFDKTIIGVGPGYTFAKLLAEKKPGVTIGLIPCAFGATSVQLWNPASTDTSRYTPENLYNHAIRRAKLAMQSGTLTGILWHQGEHNAEREADTVDYPAEVAALVKHFRQDLNAPTVPFIAGEIGYFTYSGNCPFGEKINASINTLPGLIPNCAVVSAQDLTDMGDALHFDNASQKKFGRRYLDAYLSVAAI